MQAGQRLALESGPAVPQARVLRFDAGSGVPIYRQLVQQVRRDVMLGRLRPGDQLPSVKEVVDALSVNPNTVVKAFAELEHLGLVCAGGGGDFRGGSAATGGAAGSAKAADLADPLDRPGQAGRPRSDSCIVVVHRQTHARP